MTCARLITRAGQAVTRLTAVIASFVLRRTPAHRGGGSSPTPEPQATWQPRKPSIERSATNSTASITVPANPHRPLAWSVEPLSGSGRLVKLTAVYEQSLDASESAILRSVELGSMQPSEAMPLLRDVDDEAWLSRVRGMHH